jgi:dsDNA-specific endonuclease/ATPase MutS2
VERLSTGAGGGKTTLGLLRGELEQVKQLLAPTQEDNKQEVQDTKKEVQDSKQELKQEVNDTKKELKQDAKDTNREVRDMKQKLTVLAAVQDETKQEAGSARGKAGDAAANVDVGGEDGCRARAASKSQWPVA